MGERETCGSWSLVCDCCGVEHEYDRLVHDCEDLPCGCGYVRVYEDGGASAVTDGCEVDHGNG